MRLSVEWLKATRPLDERVRVELAIRNGILDYFHGGVENAKKAHDFYNSNPRAPFLDWPQAVYKGYRAAHGIVSPCEYARLRFKVAFKEGIEQNAFIHTGRTPR